MRRALLAPAAVAALSLAAPAMAEPVVLAPSSKWTVDFADDKCRLLRTFGEGEDRHLLTFHQYWPSDDVGLTLAGPAVRNFVSLARTDLRLFEAQPPVRGTPFAGKVEGFGDAVIYPSVTLDGSEAKDEDEADKGAETNGRPLPLLDTAFAKQAAFLELRQGGRRVRLETGPMDAAFTVLNQCTLNLLRVWGLDAEAHRTAQSTPRWLNRAALVRRIVAVYPREAQRRGEQAIMRMRVIVATDGSVESCTLLKATNTEKLESPACAVMKDARFAPARDAAGQPLRSFYAAGITYKLG